MYFWNSSFSHREDEKVIMRFQKHLFYEQVSFGAESFQLQLHKIKEKYGTASMKTMCSAVKNARTFSVLWQWRIALQVGVPPLYD